MNIKVTEILSRIITIDSESENEPISTIEKMYKNEEIVLDYLDLECDVLIEREEENLNSEKDVSAFGI